MGKLRVSEFIVQCLASFVICFLAMQTAFIFSWPSHTTALFRSNETVLSAPMTSLEVSLVGGLPNLGGLLMCPFYSYATKTFGRKYTTMLSGVPFIITWAIISVTNSIPVVLVALTLAGVGISGQKLSMVYVSEISHVSFRGGLTSAGTSFFFLGVMISYIMGGTLSYMTVVHIHLASSIVSTLLILFIKDSPVTLLMAGKEKEAAEAIAFYKRVDVRSKTVATEISRIKLEIDPKLENMLENKEDPDASADLLLSKKPLTVSENVSPWRFLIKSKTSQRALVMVLIIITLTIMMGCVVIQVYAEPLFKEAVPSLPPNLCSILLAVVYLAASLVCVNFVDRFGRKFLLFWTSSASGVCTLLLGTQLQFHWAPAWVTALLIYVFSFVYTSGCNTVPFVLSAEIFLPEVRNLNNSILFVFVLIVNFTTVFIFHPLVEVVGLGLVFYIFSVICLAGATYTKFCIPETKGLSVVEIQKLFMKEQSNSQY